MALVFGDRVKETTTTTGTGTLTLAGPPSGYKAFSSAMSINDTCYYCITSDTSTIWELGIGTYSDVNKLTRTTILDSSTGARLTLDAGTKNVFITLPKKHIDDMTSATGIHSALTTGVHGVSGNVVGTTDTQVLSNKTLTTPVLGAATATSINKVGITAPASSATLTIADGKTFTSNNTLTLSGTDSSTLNIGSGGTLGTAAYTASTAYEASGAIATHAALTTGVHGLGTMAAQNTGTYAGPGSSQAFSVGALTATSISPSGYIHFTGSADAELSIEGAYNLGLYGASSAGTAGKGVILYQYNGGWKAGIKVLNGATNIQLVPDSGYNVLVGTATASTGAKLEVAGAGSFTSLLTLGNTIKYSTNGVGMYWGGGGTAFYGDDTGGAQYIKADVAGVTRFNLTSTGLAVTGDLSVASSSNGGNLKVTSTEFVAGLQLLQQVSVDAGTRNWCLLTNHVAYGDLCIKVSNARFGDPLNSGTTIAQFSSTGLAVTGALTAGYGLFTGSTHTYLNLQRVGTNESLVCFKPVTLNVTTPQWAIGQFVDAATGVFEIGSYDGSSVTKRAIFSSTGLAVTGETATTTLRINTAPSASVATPSTHKVQVNLNGSTYYLLATT